MNNETIMDWVEVPKYAFRQLKYSFINLRKYNLWRLLLKPITQTTFNYGKFYMGLLEGKVKYSTDCGRGYDFNLVFINNGLVQNLEELPRLKTEPQIYFINKFYNGLITKEILENVLFHDYRIVIPTSDRAKDILEDYQILCLWNPHLRIFQIYSHKVNINKKLCLFNNSKYIGSKEVVEGYIKYIEKDLLNLADYMNEITQIESYRIKND